MAVINILDKNTINQIAAGEVIERPASVVKELIENSIDAGATAVSCEISGGGINLIRITDNGTGIDPEDVKVAFMRHATSKIKDASDLNEVTSLGFRGEALASIAAVAEVELITRTESNIDGIRYRINGGEEIGIEKIGCPKGTTFIIRNLFGNVPVRRKFLKSATTEGSYINEVVEKIALSHPEVSIKFINNSRTVIFTTGSGLVKDIIYGIYGREITANLVEVSYKGEDGINISGFVAKPVVARSNRNLEHYYVNGRYIRSNAISKGIEQAFAPYLMLHKYPFTALHIEIPAGTMDVNVHPTKQEVRFEKTDAVFTAVYSAVSAAMKSIAIIPKTVTPNVDSQKEAQNRIASNPYVQKAPEPFETTRRENANINAVKESVVKENSVKENAVMTNTVKEKSLQESSLLQNITKDTVYTLEQIDTNIMVEDILKADACDDFSVVREETPADKLVEKTEDISDGTDSGAEVSGDIAAFNRVMTGNLKNEDTAVEYKQMVLETDIFKNDGQSAPIIRPETKEEFKKGMYDGFRIIGQLFNTYWIVELKDKMYLIDQHAAHEKTIYERLVKEYNNSSIISQNLCPSIIVSLSASECQIVENHLDDLQKLGFTMENFGGREYSLSTIPIQLNKMDPVDLLHELIDSYDDDNVRLARQTATMNWRLATCACKAAVKGNMKMSLAEAQVLIEELLKLENPFNCPHGRPVIISMSQTEVERKFKRII